MTRLRLALLLTLSLGPATLAAERSALGERTADRSTAVRSVVATAVASADLDALREQVLGIIQSTGWRSSEWGVLAVSLDRGDTLVSYGNDLLLAPASNQKVVTSAAALYHLGPEYRFSTFLVTRGDIDGGVLRGDLIVYGTGDPAISARMQGDALSVWRSFAEALRREGIHRVEGRILGDDSFFQGPTRRPAWNPLDLDNWYAAPVSALSYQENVVTLQVSGGPPGTRAVVRTQPDGAEVPMVNASMAVPGTSIRGLRIGRDDPDGPIVLEGEVGSDGRGAWREMTVADPSTYAVSVLRSVLESEGIEVEGGIGRVRSASASALSASRTVAPAFRNAATPPIRTIAIHRSPPLHELLAVLNKRSHNLYGELLLFAMGRAVVGEGSFAGGSEVIGRYLQDELGIAPTEFVIDDGSGLSRLNRATPAVLVEVLRDVSGRQHAEAFWSSLPEAGNRRELGRMYYTPAAGNLRAKTGTIARVSALSGQVRTSEGERVLFSIVSNNVPATSRAKRVEDAIGVELASFRRTTMPAEAITSD